MPLASKQDLYEDGVEVALMLCMANRWYVPRFKDNPRLRSTGLYTTNLVQVNVRETAWLVNNPTVRRQSRPGWKTDRTATGVVLHELGHHIWFCHADEEQWAAWRAVIRSGVRWAYKERVSGYEPCVEEAFAETFRLWALNPTLLKAACPARYKALTQVFKARHPNPLPWRRVIPKTFHDRAAAWVAQSAR